MSLTTNAHFKLKDVLFSRVDVYQFKGLSGLLINKKMCFCQIADFGLIALCEIFPQRAPAVSTITTSISTAAFSSQVYAMSKFVLRSFQLSQCMWAYVVDI